uniref:Tetraspanin 32 n=1 Tax=Chinchilla lanigera TaxID=34839 RepID=A0A8C2W2G1_CHILA
VATMAVLMYFGDHFAIMIHVSLERNPYDAVHHWAFYVGISLAALLILGASLSTTAAVKEAQGLMAGDCLQSIQSFLRIHQNIVSMLTSAGLALTVYAMLLSSFLWFAILSGYNLDRKGTYTVTPRAHGCQPQESSLFRHSQ